MSAITASGIVIFLQRTLDIQIGPLGPSISGFSYAEVSGWLAGPQDVLQGYSVQRRSLEPPNLTMRLRLSLAQAPCIRLRDVAQVLVMERRLPVTIQWFSFGGSVPPPWLSVASTGLGLNFDDVSDGCATQVVVEGS
ncbi:hypothetical protein J4558_04020 [Leptolyngbya sp. 15MV]|nr:hypothetical protein J4558_04020 [Leptolyngbya sp. 15MV]